MVEWCQHQPAELVAALTLLSCYGLIGIFGFFFGKSGLKAYMTLAVLVGNLQVFKASPFSLLSHPVALGTGVFVSLGVVTDLITELYGPTAAKRGVWISFLSFLGMTWLMVLTVGSPPVLPGAGSGSGDHFWDFHQHLEALFLPMPALFCASVMAYMSSEFIDIWIFSWLKKRSGEAYLWRRVFLSTAISGFVDNTVFSLLAWVVFSAHPLELGVVFQTYIWGTYGMRLIMTLPGIPVMYGLKHLLKNRFPGPSIL
jgi:hypothetical protein